MPRYVLVPPVAAELRLSSRELDVLLLIAEGLSDKETAGRMGVSSATVRTHVASLVRKLGAANRTQLCLRAFEAGVITHADESD